MDATTTDAPTDAPEISGRERILDAAIGRFAEHGVAGASLKSIAADADVSPGLIVHHFGSKQGLREACDARILGDLRAQMRDAAGQGTAIDVLEALRRRQERHASALPYLARALAEGGPSVDTLVDELAQETIRSMERGVAEGTYRPSAHPRERALVLLVWSLGAVALHDHVRRLLGADLAGEPTALLPYLRGATEILTGAVTTDAFTTTLREAIARLEQE